MPNYKFHLCAGYYVSSAISDVTNKDPACPIKLSFEDKLLGTAKSVTIGPEERQMVAESCNFSEEVFVAMQRWRGKEVRPALEIVYKRGKEDVLQMTLFPSLL